MSFEPKARWYRRESAAHSRALVAGQGGIPFSYAGRTMTPAEAEAAIANGQLAARDIWKEVPRVHDIEGLRRRAIRRAERPRQIRGEYPLSFYFDGAQFHTVDPWRKTKPLHAYLPKETQQGLESGVLSPKLIALAMVIAWSGREPELADEMAVWLQEHFLDRMPKALPWAVTSDELLPLLQHAKRWATE